MSYNVCKIQKIIFYSILFYSTLFYSILFYSILSLYVISHILPLPWNAFSVVG